MGWFDQQIEYRKKRERELLADSYDNISKSITGRKVSNAITEGADVNDAIAQLLNYFNIKTKEVPAKIRDLEDRLDYLLSASGIMYRQVILEDDWHKDAMGAMITRLEEDGSVITILPGTLGGYEYTDPRTGKKVRITGKEEKKIGKEAFCFYLSSVMLKKPGRTKEMLLPMRSSKNLPALWMEDSDPRILSQGSRMTSSWSF